MPVTLDVATNEFKPWDSKSTSKEDMLTTDFWIIGVQHTIEAMTVVIKDPSLNTEEDIQSYCHNH